MIAGGNLNAVSFFKSKGANPNEPSAREKYSSKVAKLYKMHLDNLAKDVKVDVGDIGASASEETRPARNSNPEDGLDALMKEALNIGKPAASTKKEVAPVEESQSNAQAPAPSKQRVVIRKAPKQELNAAPATSAAASSNLTTSLSSASGMGLRAPSQRSKLILSTAPVAGTSSGTGLGNSTALAAKDDDFDFDAPPVVVQKKEEPVAEPNPAALLKPKGANKVNNYSNPENIADRFKNAKSISSDQYFGRSNQSEEDTISQELRKEKFSGSRAISSDDYFNRRPSNESPRSSPTVEISQLGAAVLEKGAKFASSLMSGRR
jgi:hypothetical protein